MSDSANSAGFCPGCRAPIGSFQTKCSSCGRELGAAPRDETVASFFKKLDELSQQEYKADKEREGKGGKKKKKQPKIMVLCEAVAIISIILLILQLTPLPGMLKGEPAVRGGPIDWSYDIGENYVEFIVSNDSEFSADEYIYLTIIDGDRNPIERSITRLQRGNEETLFFNDAGYYLVNILDGAEDAFFYPTTRNPVRMSGTIMLSFDGRRLARYVERNGKIIYE